MALLTLILRKCAALPLQVCLLLILLFPQAGRPEHAQVLWQIMRALYLILGAFFRMVFLSEQQTVVSLRQIAVGKMEYEARPFLSRVLHQRLPLSGGDVFLFWAVWGFGICHGK